MYISAPTSKTFRQPGTKFIATFTHWSNIVYWQLPIVYSAVYMTVSQNISWHHWISDFWSPKCQSAQKRCFKCAGISFHLKKGSEPRKIWKIQLTAKKLSQSGPNSVREIRVEVVGGKISCTLHIQHWKTSFNSLAHFKAWIKKCLYCFPDMII